MEKKRKKNWSDCCIEWIAWMLIMRCHSFYPIILILSSYCRCFFAASHSCSLCRWTENRQKVFLSSRHNFTKMNWHASIISWLLHFESFSLRWIEWVNQISKFSISNINLSSLSLSLALLQMFEPKTVREFDRLTKNRIQWHETKAYSEFGIVPFRV